MTTLEEEAQALEERARAFATEAHDKRPRKPENRVRKYTGEPYITHPEAVAALVKTVLHTPAMVAAALLHDTVEDTFTTHEQIRDEFGSEVAWLVEQLTDVSKPEDGNRAARKALDLAHAAQACPMAQTIKYADMLENTLCILDHDPKFAKVYLVEKMRLLAVCRRGDPTLLRLCEEAVAAGVESLLNS